MKAETLDAYARVHYANILGDTKLLLAWMKVAGISDVREALDWIIGALEELREAEEER